MGTTYAINNTTLTGIADAIRDMRHEKGSMTPAQMEAKIRASRLGIPIEVSVHVNPETGEWERPEEYPDLDVLAEQIGDDDDCVYFTYDLRKTPGYGWIGLYCTLAVSGKKWVLERGHVSNGAFVSDYSSGELASGTYFRQDLDSTNGDVQLWRVTSADGHISGLRFITNTTTTANNFFNNVQPCVERVGRLNWLAGSISGTNFSASYTATSWSTVWMERDAIKTSGKGNVTSLGNAYQGGYSLQSVDVSEWSTSNWEVTTIANLFYYCYNLPSVDLSEWDTSGWAVTNISYLFHSCASLQSIDLSAWDTSNWKVTSMAYTFYYCYSLKSIDMTGWDTSGWTNTSLVGCFCYCLSLESLDLSMWDTSEWAVTSLANCFSWCISLNVLDLSSWNTSGWNVTSLASCFNWCISLQSINMTGWDTSGWTVNTIASCFAYCCCLQSLDLSVWDTSEWVVTTMASCFASCYSLQSLDLTEWDTSKWVVTTMASCFGYCYSLQSLDLSEWDTSGWVVTTMSNCFNYCFSIQFIDLTGWDTSKWEPTNITYIFYNCYNLKSIKGLSDLDVGSWPVTAFNGMFYNCFSLTEIDISDWDVSSFGTITDARNFVAACWCLKSLKMPKEMWLNGSTSNANSNANDCRNLEYVSGFRSWFNHSYANCVKLTPAALVNIMNDLPTVTTARTITLGQNNKNKLTAAQIAVATQKGWTVAT